MEDLSLTYASLLTNGSWLLEAYAISSDRRYIVYVKSLISWYSDGRA
jgi:hypothetical protein